MAIVNLFKSWQFNLNNRIATTPGQAAYLPQMMLKTKQIMTGWASFPWTVVGSSDGVAASMDGTDRWIDTGDLIWASGASAHSWIVLKQVGIASNFQLVVDLNSGAQDIATTYFSPSSGFTGGSITARPTATDEVRILLNQAWCGFTANHSGYCFIHAMQSTDGNHCRIFMCQYTIGGFPSLQGLWLFEKPASPLATWTNPCCACTFGSISFSNLVLANFVNNGNLAFRHPDLGPSTGLNTGLFLSSEGVSAGANAFINYTNSGSRVVPLQPIGLEKHTNPQRARFGFLPDIFFGPAGVSWGTGYPADKSRELMTIDQFVVPWDGSKMVL